MIMTVEVRVSSCVQLLIRNDNANKKKIPQIKATLDKNKSQRIGDFSVK